MVLSFDDELGVDRGREALEVARYDRVKALDISFGGCTDRSLPEGNSWNQMARTQTDIYV
jgi:hypothetical protein